MKRVTKILFEPGEKQQLLKILRESNGEASAAKTVMESFNVDPATAQCAVSRFWKTSKENVES